MATLLVRYSEIGLKSTPVRLKFENRLRDNMINMFMADGVEAFVERGDARFYVETSDAEKASRSLKKVFGVASFSLTTVTTANMEDICKATAEYAIGKVHAGQTFAVRPRREGNKHPYRSIDVGREAGSAIDEAIPGLKVDLNHPDKEFFVEVRNNHTYIFDEYVRCHAGLPLGSQGRVLAYVDDDRGILSAWLMMKRGCKVIVMSEIDCSILKEYDPELKVIGPEDKVSSKILGIVMGTSLDTLGSVDVTKYTLPVFFPTIAMTDTEVADMMATIRDI